MSTIDVADEVRHLQKRLATSRIANLVLVFLLGAVAANLWLQSGIAKTALTQPHAAAQTSAYGTPPQAGANATPGLPFQDPGFVFTSP